MRRPDQRDERGRGGNGEYQNYPPRKPNQQMRGGVQQDKKGSGSDLRTKIERQQGGGPPSGPSGSQRLQGPGAGPSSTGVAGKPDGYDERRRQREMERRRTGEPAGPPERGGSRGSADYHHANDQQTDKRTVVRSKMYSDKMMGGSKKPYDYGGPGAAAANRGKRMSRSPPQAYMDNNDYNRRDSRDAKGGVARGRQELKRPLSNERDLSSKRRKPALSRGGRDLSAERRSPPSSSKGGSASNLKELEFRARALQSLLSKKEKSNEASASSYTRRGDKR